MNFFKKIINLFRCFLGKHEFEYMWGNYHTEKDVFECRNCGKRIEE